jgi:hypothetical protein
VLKSLRTKIPLAICAGGLLGSRSFRGLTQIFAGRNDGYGVQPVEKLMAVVEWNRRWLRCRTILVEWNPPSNAPLLSEMLTRRFPDVIGYVVSSELHSKVVGSNNWPFLEYLAKNVGIRRAKTDWIMVANTDVILGPDCLLKIGDLRETDILRTRRVDIPWAGSRPSFLSILDSRKYLRFRVIGEPSCSAPGDLTIASRELWHQTRGFDESLADKRVLCDVRGMYQLVAHGGKVVWIGTHFHFDHPESTSQAVTSNHGELFGPADGIPYQNSESWGLANAFERPLGERIWLLKPYAS